MLRTAIVFAGIIVATAAEAQTPFVQQSLDSGDTTYCATAPENQLDAVTMQSCAQAAMGDQNDLVALKWATRSAEKGDEIAAFWVGDIYESGSKGEKPDFVQAYKWFDIAATLKANEIAKLPATNDPSFRENNKQAINYRDAEVEHLTPEQLKDAQQQSRAWLQAHGFFTPP